MSQTAAPFHPRQERSRATLERLLGATIGVLDQEGLEGAVIPRIAALAGMAPANIYRRFADKPALLRAAFLHALDQSQQANSATLATQLRAPALAAASRKLVRLLFQQYRRHPHFLRALNRFVEMDTDPDFVRQVRAALGNNLDQVVAILLAHRAEIVHKEPAAALRFAILNTTCSIEAYTLDPHAMWHAGTGIGERELADRLTRSFVAYLTAA
ncbi:MAG TPA: TetR/AcrR family transcriptional regulator [Burkholderiaceae bacterium]